jgi:hypothetical protein
LIQQSYFAAGPNNMMDDKQQEQELQNRDHDRLMKLLIDELKRKKGMNIMQECNHGEQIEVLIGFWKESLIKGKILQKL